MSMIRRAPAAALRGHVSSYYGYREETGAPLTRLEGPGAWPRLRATHGRIPIAGLARELGGGRERSVARFREEVGLTPKGAARLLRFARARELAGQRPWAEVACECGYYDQSHL